MIKFDFISRFRAFVTESNRKVDVEWPHEREGKPIELAFTYDEVEAFHAELEEKFHE